MATDWLTENRRRIALFLLFAGLIFLAYFTRKALWLALKPFIYALILAYLFNPLVNFAQKKGMKRIASSLLIVLFIFLLMLLFGVLVLPSIIRDAMELIKRMPAVIADVRKDLINLLERLNIAFSGTLDARRTVDDITNQGYQALMGMLTGLISNLGGLLDLFLIPIMMFYMLKDRDFFIAEIRSWTKAAQWKNIQTVGRDINQVLGGFVRGRLILTLFVGLATGSGAAVIGIPNAITIGILAGILDLIPYFGPWIGGILPVVMALISPEPIKAVWMVLWIVVVQQLESSVLSPKILAVEVGMHPLLVIFSVLFFGALFGVLGMIVGVPVMASALTLVRYFHGKDKEKERRAFIYPRV